jgi:integrase
MRAVTGRLADLEHGPCGPEIRAGVELLIDAGRRPAEICGLALDCLTYDAGGAPVLVYDNHKAARAGRRLPISQATVAVITVQQQRVRERFPHGQPASLALLPTVIGNPDGARPISVQSLTQRHRDWINRMPALTLADGTEYDKAKISPYSWRHSYAQRHADAGIAPDVLRDLMSHRNINTTEPSNVAAGGGACPVRFRCAVTAR